MSKVCMIRKDFECVIFTPKDVQDYIAFLSLIQAVGGFTEISDLSDVPGLGYGIIEQSRNFLVCKVASKSRLRASR